MKTNRFRNGRETPEQKTDKQTNRHFFIEISRDIGVKSVQVKFKLVISYTLHFFANSKAKGGRGILKGP